MRTSMRTWQLLVGSAVVATLAPAALAETKKISTAEQRKEVGITVYNQNFGLVREVRDVDVGSGTVQLEFRDVAARIQPETVSIKSLSNAGSLNVLEQNYRFDLLTPQKLLEKHVGKKVRVWRWNEKLGRDEVSDAEILSVAGGQTVMKINGEVTFDFPGRISFPSVPDNLMSKPTLVWKIDSKGAKQKLEATYLTQGLGWRSDYVFVINDTDTAGDLTGWVTLTNQSGAAYKNAKLKLVAGDVQRVSGGEDYDDDRRAPAGKAAESQQRFQEEGFFEYHLYTLAQPTDVLENEQKQVTLLEAKNAKVQKKLIYYGQQYWYRGQYGEVQKNQKVGVYLDVKNTKENGLGMPLPKGTVRVYKADKSGAKQFIGEDRIDHTPRDEKVRIKMGEAFDVVGDRKQMSWKTLGTCTSESTWEIELRNHKDASTRVEVYEPIGGDWTILESTHKHDKKDAFTFTFDVEVPANGKTKIKYRVRVKWC
ncbi:MAG: DUF4139 domain-containing protein [Myxococcales bacterium]|nr:DUF4139 domain-containing protein [Myxococcales bacterium]